MRSNEDVCGEVVVAARLLSGRCRERKLMFLEYLLLMAAIEAEEVIRKEAARKPSGQRAAAPNDPVDHARKQLESDQP